MSSVDGDEAAGSSHHEDDESVDGDDGPEAPVPRVRGRAKAPAAPAPAPAARAQSQGTGARGPSGASDVLRSASKPTAVTSDNGDYRYDEEVAYEEDLPDWGELDRTGLVRTGLG